MGSAHRRGVLCRTEESRFVRRQIFVCTEPLKEAVIHAVALIARHVHGVTSYISLGQSVVTGIEGLHKIVEFLIGGQVAQADAPRGQRVAPVMADGEHCPGGQTVGGAGRLYRDSDAPGIQLPLKHGAFYVLYAQIQDLRYSVLRTVDVHHGVAGKFCAQAGV